MSTGQPGEDDLRRRLETHRNELLAKIASLGSHDPAEMASLGFGKRIGDATSYAVERMTGAFQARTLFETVKDLERALDRLNAGHYGLCVACGGPIPADRLLAVPWAARCMPCSTPPAGPSSGRRRGGLRG